LLGDGADTAGKPLSSVRELCWRRSGEQQPDRPSARAASLSVSSRGPLSTYNAMPWLHRPHRPDDAAPASGRPPAGDGVAAGSSEGVLSTYSLPTALPLSHSAVRAVPVCTLDTGMWRAVEVPPEAAGEPRHSRASMDAADVYALPLPGGVADDLTSRTPTAALTVPAGGGAGVRSALFPLPEPLSPHDSTDRAGVCIPEDAPLASSSSEEGASHNPDFTELPTLAGGSTCWDVTTTLAGRQVTGVAAGGACNRVFIRGFHMPKRSRFRRLRAWSGTVAGGRNPLMGAAMWPATPVPNALYVTLVADHTVPLPVSALDIPGTPARALQQSTTSAFVLTYSIVMGAAGHLVAHLMIASWLCSETGVDVLGCHLAALRAHITCNVAFALRLSAMGISDLRVSGYVDDAHVGTWTHHLMGWKLVAWRPVTVRVPLDTSDGRASTDGSRDLTRYTPVVGVAAMPRHRLVQARQGVLQLVWPVGSEPTTPLTVTATAVHV
jgi:hypothetical protein